MQTVIVAFLFPKRDTGRKLMKALLLYLIGENKLLSTESLGDDKAMLAKVMLYARASFVLTTFDQVKIE